MNGFFQSGTIGGGGMVGSFGALALADPVLSALRGLTFGSAARLLTGLTNGQAVDTFTNTAGGGVTITQAGTQRPLFTTNFLNGLPVLAFDGTDDRMVFNTLPFNTGNSPFTAYAVFRAGTSASTRFLFRLGGASTRRGVGIVVPSGGAALRFEVTADVLDLVPAGLPNQNWMIVAMRYNHLINTIFGDSYGSVISSGLKVLGAAANWDGAMGYNSLGQGATGSGVLSGHVAELWFYNECHTDLERNSAVARLKALYNLP